VTARAITLDADDGHRLAAWLAEPEGPVRGGVVILHAVYGPTRHMGDVCTKWAQAGYRAVTPALFDRLEPGVVVPYSAPQDGSARYAQLTEAQIFTDIRAAAAAANPDGPAIISGFCTGGTWAWRAAANLDMSFAAQVNFYGSHVTDYLGERPRCPTQMHYGDLDHVVPPSKVTWIAKRRPEVELHVYHEAGHAFFNPDQDNYNADAADLAWARTIDFLEDLKL